MKCSNCKDNTVSARKIIGPDGEKYLCPACIVMDDTEFEDDNPYSFLRDTLRQKHRRQK